MSTVIDGVLGDNTAEDIIGVSRDCYTRVDALFHKGKEEGER